MTDERDPSEDGPQRGEVREQDPQTAKPRAPSVAEQRARRKAAEQQAAEQQRAAAAAERKQMIKKRVMIGGAVTVGVAALVAAYYTSKPKEVTAYCTTQDGAVAQNEQVCDAGYVESHGGHVGPNGVLFMPLFLGGPMRQYHYTYGGSVQNGHVVGGSMVKPNNANIKTPHGKVVQRGGFGVGGKGRVGS